jgi:hypothetical protein
LEKLLHEKSDPSDLGRWTEDRMARIQGDVAGAYVREAIMLCNVNNKNKI